MNKGATILVTVFCICALISCKKDDVSENCYICSNDLASIDVCEENGNFVVDGEVIENENGATLEDLIRAVETNENNDPNLEGISCRKN